MKIQLTIILLALSISAYSQEPGEGTNAIKIKGVTFKQVGDALLDAGYSFEKTDSVFQTIQTNFKDCKTVEGVVMNIFVRFKDSSAIITGKAFRPREVGANNYLGGTVSKEAATFTITYTSGKAKKIFNEMNDFALSFKTLVYYLVQ